MAIVTEVESGIYAIAPQRGEPGSEPVMSYLVADEKAALVEPGAAAGCPALLEGIKQLGYDQARISYIIPTHVHIDHGGGAGWLARQLPQALVLAHPAGSPHFRDPTRLIASTRMVFGDDFEKELGPILPVAEGQLHVVQDGETLSLGSRVLKVLYTPGHAPNHISIYDLKSRGLFSGEAFGCYPLPGADMVVPAAAPPSFDLEVALETIEKLMELKPAIIFYTHDGVRRDVDTLGRLALESTRAYAQIILQGAKAGESEQQIFERIKAHVRSATGVEPPCTMAVAGYTVYFKRKGLI